MSSFSSLSADASTAFFTSASVAFCPSGTVSTTRALLPEASGKTILSSSSATCEGAPGMVKASSKWRPPIPAARPSTASRATQATITRHRAA